VLQRSLSASTVSAVMSFPKRGAAARSLAASASGSSGRCALIPLAHEITGNDCVIVLKVPSELRPL
jgi:hypothetical protein